MSIVALRSSFCSPPAAASPFLPVDIPSQHVPSFSNVSVKSNGPNDSSFDNQTRCGSGSVAGGLVFSFKSVTYVELRRKSFGKRFKGRFRRSKYETCAQANVEGDNVPGRRGIEEGTAHATVEQSKRLLELRNELLGQIAERKKLVTTLKDRLRNPEEQRKADIDVENSKKVESTVQTGEANSHILQEDASVKFSMPQSREATGTYTSSRTPADDYSPTSLPRPSTVAMPASQALRPGIETMAWQSVVEGKDYVAKEFPEESEIATTAGPTEEKPLPLAGPNVMNVIVVAAECAPWSKTGGLGDVAGALPKALARRGHRVMVVVPRYAQYDNAWETGVRKRYNVAGQDMEVGYFHGYIDGVDYVFVDNSIFHGFANNIYGGSREDVLKRMVLFCKAAVEIPWFVPCGGVCYGDGNLVFIANDWHTALLPVYLQAYYRDNGLMNFTRSVLVIHNMAHQGRGPLSEFALLGLPDHYIDKFRLYDPIGGEHMNIFMAGLITAHRIITVSHGYAWECQTQEGGWGLDGVIREQNWKLRGIVNGIDEKEWSPELDIHLKSDGYTNYSLDTLESGKAACKAALQQELGLPIRGDVPMLGFIGRLDHQKGVDILADAMHWMMEQDLQLLMLGSGRADLENMLRSFEAQYREKVRGWVGFSIKTAHRITAGCDMLLMPSRFEPCGLNQLYAMRYGTIPVVHAVGGLRDTVKAFDPFSNTGTGWTFDKADPSAMIHALGNAIWTYREFKDSWKGIQKRGMSQDLSWDNAAKQYEEVMLAAKYQW